jgi:hypothetical protein
MRRINGNFGSNEAITNGSARIYKFRDGYKGAKNYGRKLRLQGNGGISAITSGITLSLESTPRANIRGKANGK